MDIIIPSIAIITLLLLVIIYIKGKQQLNTTLEQIQRVLLANIEQQQSQHLQQVQQQNDSVMHHFKTGLHHQLEQNTQHLHHSMGQFQKTVHQHLESGLQQSQGTFHHIRERLAIIDEAQKKMFDLSAQINQLQHVLSNKQQRGHLGEIQLMQIIQDALPKTYYQAQHTLSNQKRVDCLIQLPGTHGSVAVDAKFPLESYQQLNHHRHHPVEHKTATTQFKQSIKTHIKAIAEKYIIPGETSPHAIMFIPSEAVFGEICTNHPTLLQFASEQKVWLASPTTMMAILNTAQVVIKDHLQHQQIHHIQKHMATLGQDFTRLHKRLSELATHIRKTHEDVDNVNISANKIISHFRKIDRVETIDNDDLKQQ